MANMGVWVAQSASEARVSRVRSSLVDSAKKMRRPRQRGDTTSRTKGIPPNGGARRVDRFGSAVCARAAQTPSLPNAAIH